jgi:hypothetical protein
LLAAPAHVSSHVDWNQRRKFAYRIVVESFGYVCESFGYVCGG